MNLYQEILHQLEVSVQDPFLIVILKREVIVNGATRNKWVAEPAPIFTQDRTLFDEIIK